VNLTAFVIDDDKASRDSLLFLFRSEGITSRAYGSAAEFLAQLEPEHRGCIVTDVRMPVMDGMQLIAKLKELGCRIPTVVITGHADVPLAVQAMRAGVIDFIEKPFEGDSMLAAVRRAFELSQRADAQETQLQMVLRRLSTLTEREMQVCDAVTAGAANKLIAAQLAISPRTVEIYRANVMAKMQADSLSELVRMMLLVDAQNGKFYRSA